MKNDILNKNCILIIDDDFINREVLKNILGSQFRCEEAENGAEGLAFIERHQDELCAILLDYQMPVIDGMELMEILNKRGIPDYIPIFLITSNEEWDIAQAAYEMGVMDVITKPILPFVVERRIQAVIELFQAREALGKRVKQQEYTILENVKTIDTLHKGMLETLASAIEFRDVESGEHTQRIYDITKLILQKTEMGLGYTDEEIDNMAIGAIMHDVGKISISDMILNKPGRLTKEEYEFMKTHTTKGAEIIARLCETQDHPSYWYALDIARHHHERWDGRGYPDGLKGDEISVWSQVVSIADVYDALVSPRVYKKSFSAEEAVSMIVNNECGVFNPKLLSSFLAVEPELRRLYQEGEQTTAQLDDEKKNQAEVRDPMDSILVTAAVQQFYDMIICANLTRNSFYIMDYSRFMTHCTGQSGVFDELIASGAMSIPESHREKFLDKFSREALLRTFAAGKKMVTLEHPQYADNGDVMQVSTSALLMEDPRNGDVRNITLIRYLGGGEMLERSN